MSFLPICKDDMKKRGWDQLDFLYISGDAYVDHPSFGHAIITRLLESAGFKVGIIAQPNIKNNEDFLKLGKPRLAVLISSGVIDSMVNHYTARKKPRSNDLYTPGSVSGKRPDRAVIVYANKSKELFKDVPVIIGGTEASLRRFAHYDYWDNKVRRSVLLDSRADVLIYGMGERPIIEIANMLKNGISISQITDVRGTCYATSKNVDSPKIQNFIKSHNKENKEFVLVSSYEECRDSKEKYAKAFRVQYEEQDSISGRHIVQSHGDRYMIQNPPVVPMTTKEMDRIYSLPYERNYHPIYEKNGGVPAIEEVKFSLISSRGCFGGCAFCALNFHQGRVIQTRSHESIIQEAIKLTWMEDFKGYIHDVGGPTANFRVRSCKNQEKNGVCKTKQCLSPVPCKNLEVSHDDYLSLLKKLREIQGVKKVFIRSGIRYDYVMLDKSDEFLETLCEHHISGQLKVAPEHTCGYVLELMGKPKSEVYKRFTEKYYKINKRIGKEQYLVPYLVSGHPGSDLDAAIELAENLRDLGYTPEQVQDFYPTPGTLSTAMFYTGFDPRTMKKVYVPDSPKEKAMQRALLQYRKPQNYQLVYDALMEAGREDLIGFGPKCLIRPRKIVYKIDGEKIEIKSNKSKSNPKKKNLKRR